MMPIKSNYNTMMQQTSLYAYEELRPELAKKQAIVYAAISLLRSACNQEISRFLNIPINCVTPRVHELRKIGLVKEDQIVVSPSGRSATAWRVR